MIQLRAIEPEDLEVFYTLENSPEIWDHTETDAPYSRFALKRYIASLTTIYDSGEMRLAIDLKEEGQPTRTIGIAELHHYNVTQARAEVGIALLQRFRGKGYAAQAIEQLELYAQDRLHIHALYAFISANNVHSQQLFEKCNYQKVAHLPNWHFAKGEYHDTGIYLKLFEKK